MKKSEKLKLPFPISVNGNIIVHIVIGQHYRENHAQSMNDEIILQLVQSLDGKSFKTDSVGNGVEYYVADIQLKNEFNVMKIYRIIWLFEGAYLEIIGVINAYRIRKKKKI